MTPSRLLSSRLNHRTGISTFVVMYAGRTRVCTHFADRTHCGGKLRGLWHNNLDSEISDLCSNLLGT